MDKMQYIFIHVSDPAFIPRVQFKGSTSDAITLGWIIPQNLTDYYHFYNVSYRARNGPIHYANFSGDNPEILVERLKSGMDYGFKVSLYKQSLDIRNDCIGYTNHI